MSEKQSSKDGCGVCCGKVASVLPLFNPKSVAVVGATEKPNSVGRTVLWNLISSPFGGTVYPINPNRPSVLGIKAYPSLAACPGDVDLIVVCTPAKTVQGIIAEAAQKGVKGAVVISAGFKEIGPKGAELERQLAEEAGKTGMRIIGPNCLGIMNPITGLNASFAPAVAAAGSIGFISQSGALGCAVLDWCAHNGVGLSHFSSIGSMMDVNWGDLISYLGDDENTT
jgi:acetyltransferase